VLNCLTHNTFEKGEKKKKKRELGSNGTQIMSRWSGGNNTGK